MTRTLAFLLLATIVLQGCAWQLFPRSDSIPKIVTEEENDEAPKQCYTGLIIITKDKSAVEVRGCPDEWAIFRPVNNLGLINHPVNISYSKERHPTPNMIIASADDYGRFHLPAQEGQPARYIKFVNSYPRLHWTDPKLGEQQSDLYPVYILKRAIARHLDPAIFVDPVNGWPPLEELTHDCGEFFCGRAYHLLPPEEQAKRWLDIPDMFKSDYGRLW